MFSRRLKLDWHTYKNEGASIYKEALATFLGYEFRFSIEMPVYDDKRAEGRVEVKVKSGYSGVIWRTIYCIPPSGIPARYSYKEAKRYLEEYAYKINKQILKNSFTE